MHKKLTIINDRWRTGRQLGKGGYGKVYEVHDINDNDKSYAMKTEHLRMNDTSGRLPQEAMVLEEITAAGRTRHVAQLMDKGRIELEPGKQPIQFIVMTLLGPSLSDMRKFCKSRQFSPISVANIGIQALDAVEDVHLTGYIHRDIKPGNFMIGLGTNKHTIYIIDFGMARKIVDENGKLLPIRKDPVPFRGTGRYCPADSHKGLEYGRHHDLWCLFNSLIELRKGELPWQQLEGDMKATYEIKHKIIPQRWLKDIEPAYLTMYEYLMALHYDIEPKYEEMRNIFYIFLTENKASVTHPFEWEVGHLHHKKFDKDVSSIISRKSVTVFRYCILLAAMFPLVCL